MIMGDVIANRIFMIIIYNQMIIKITYFWL